MNNTNIIIIIIIINIIIILIMKHSNAEPCLDRGVPRSSCPAGSGSASAPAGGRPRASCASCRARASPRAGRRRRRPQRAPAELCASKARARRFFSDRSQHAREKGSAPPSRRVEAREATRRDRRRSLFRNSLSRCRLSCWRSSACAAWRPPSSSEKGRPPRSR